MRQDSTAELGRLLDDSVSQANICRMSSRVIEVEVVQVTYYQVMCTYENKCGMHHYV